MSRRLAARLLTGPFAFALGGLLELAAFALAAMRAHASRHRHA